MGLLPSAWGANKYLEICVDRFSKFPTVQITTRAAALVIKECLETYITFHAIRRVIRTDQGSGFLAKSICEFCSQQIIRLVFSPIGMHRATGLVERYIHTFRERLMTYSFQTRNPGLKVTLIEILYNIGTTVHQSLGCTPFEAHFGIR